MNKEDDVDIYQKRRNAEKEMMEALDSVVEGIGSLPGLAEDARLRAVGKAVRAQREFSKFLMVMDEIEMCIATQAFDTGNLRQPERTTSLELGSLVAAAEEEPAPISASTTTGTTNMTPTMRTMMTLASMMPPVAME